MGVGWGRLHTLVHKLTNISEMYLKFPERSTNDIVYIMMFLRAKKLFCIYHYRLFIAVNNNR